MARRKKIQEVNVEEVASVVEEAVNVPEVEKATIKAKVKQPEVVSGVKVYVSNNNPQADKVIKYLDSIKVTYQTINVDEDPEAQGELSRFGYLGTPVIAIHSLDDSWGGYRPEKMEELRKK